MHTEHLNIVEHVIEFETFVTTAAHLKYVLLLEDISYPWNYDVKNHYYTYKLNLFKQYAFNACIYTDINV